MGCAETYEQQFLTFEQAQESISAGWLPNWLPITSTDIRFSSNIDTNAVVAAFNVNQDPEWKPQECKEENIQNWVEPQIQTSWFPKSLVNAVKRGEASYYSCQHSSFLVVHDQSYFYWSLSR